MLDEATLGRHLEKMGWRAEPHGPNTYRSVHETDEGSIAVFIRLDDHWLIGSVVPFLATHGNNSFELSRWLLRQNRDMVQNKFAYDEDGDVVLTVEMPVESLDFSEVESALSRLLEDAARHRHTLRVAAESGAQQDG